MSKPSIKRAFNLSLRPFWSRQDRVNKLAILLTVSEFTLWPLLGAIKYFSGGFISAATPWALLGLAVHGLAVFFLIAVGKYVYAARATIPIVWGSLFFLVSFYGNGIHGQIILAFPLVVLLSALLLQPKSSFVSAALLSIGIFALVELQRMGIVQPKLDTLVDFGDSVALSSILMLGALIVYQILQVSRSNLEKALANEAGQQKGVLDSVLDAVVEIDTEGIVIGWNSSAESIFGWDRKETLGRGLEDLIIPSKHHSAHAQGMKHYLETGEGPVLNKRVKLTALRKDRSEFPIELQVTAVKRNSEETFTAFVRDISESENAAKQQARLLAKLQLTERRYSSIVQGSSNGIVLADSDGVISFANEAALQLFQYEESSIIGQSVDMLLPDRFRKRHSGLLASFMHRPEMRQMGAGRDLFGRRADGSEFPLEIGLNPIETEGGPQVVATIVDVSVRKSVETRNTLFSRLKTEILLAQTIDDAINACLKSVCEELGWPVGHAYVPDEENASLLVPTKLWYLSDSEKFREFVYVTETTTFLEGKGLPGRVLSDKKAAWIPDIKVDPNFPRNVKLKETNLVAAWAVPIVAFEKIIAILEFFIDKPMDFKKDLQLILENMSNEVSACIERTILEEDAKRYLAQATQAQHRFQSIIEGSPNGIVLVNSNGIITFANQQALRLFRYEESSIIGQSVNMLLPDRFRTRHSELLSSFIHHPKMRQMGAGRDLFGRRADRSEFPLEIGLNPIETEDGLQVVATIVDITTRKNAEEELRKLNSELDSRVSKATEILQNTNRSLKEFVYMASHDMQEPLRKLSSFAEMLTSEDSLSEDDREYALKAIVSGSQRAQSMIQDLLQLSKAENVSLEQDEIDVDKLIEEIQTDLQSLILESKAQIELRIDAPVSGDAALLKHVFQNLVKNAILYARPGVAPRLVIASEPVTESITRIVITDNGIGIEEDQQEAVFRPFYRIRKNDQKGTGIGLAICSRIVERHGSRLTCRSRVGEGTTFSFELPVLAETETRLHE